MIILNFYQIILNKNLKMEMKAFYLMPKKKIFINYINMK